MAEKSKSRKKVDVNVLGFILHMSPPASKKCISRRCLLAFLRELLL
jgi:hypothetical protein